MSENLPANAKQFEFRGTAKEWFGIWIVNLLLSIVTLGIYSAWAKVRTKKYFHNNTFVEGRNFDYHATGGQILKGRLIVIAAFIVFQIIITLAPILGLLLLLGMLFVYPWLVVRSLRFNARMTSFSNVRFGFVGTTGGAFVTFIVYPILMTLTLYTTYPIWDRALKRFSINNHKLGQARLKFDSGLGAFYKAFLIAIAWVVAVGLIGVLGTGINLSDPFGMFFDPADISSETFLDIAAFYFLFYLLFFVAFLPAMFIYRALTRNAIYNTTSLEGGHRLASDVTAPMLLWIAVSNMVVVVCTLFFMLPWAQVRMAKYLAAHTGYILGGSLDDFVDQQQAAGSAVGDAYTDLEGIDVGLSI